MFTSSVDVQSGIDFIEIWKDDEFTWYQFHVKGWGARDFEVHAPMAMHNATGQEVTLIWILLYSQSMVDLISNPKILVNIRKVRGKDDILVHYNSEVKIVERVGELPGYVNVWYETTGIANIPSMSRAIKKFRVVFDSEGGDFSIMVLPDMEVRFQLSPNGLYYLEAAYREDSVLLLNTVSENWAGFTRREYEGDQ